MVNDRVFGFRDPSQYDKLIQLLIKVRAPKLSKDAFRPSEVKKILNDSLQVLTDEDLTAMVSAMEQMDSLGDTLDDYRAVLQDAGIIRNEYTRYNHFILGMKGKHYLAATRKVQSARRVLASAKERMDALYANLSKHEQLKEQAETLLAQAKAQRADISYHKPCIRYRHDHQLRKESPHDSLPPLRSLPAPSRLAGKKKEEMYVALSERRALIAKEDAAAAEIAAMVEAMEGV